MDLKNLSEVLRKGKRIENESGRVLVLTPVCRASWPVLDKPRGSKMFPDAKPKFSMNLIFNAGDKTKDALVDLSAVVVPAVAEAAKRNGLIAKGWIKKGDDKRYQNDGGEWRDGYGPGIAIISAAKYPDAQGGGAPPIIDASKNALAPGLVKPGYYCRCLLSIYPSHARVCFGLERVQLLARGEIFGGGLPDYTAAVDTIEGGDDFSNEKPSDSDMWGDQGDTSFNVDAW